MIISCMYSLQLYFTTKQTYSNMNVIIIFSAFNSIKTRECFYEQRVKH
jgi:hypothetical protein